MTVVAHLYVWEQVICASDCRYQCICNPEVCQKCRSERELPSVSPLPTSNAVLTVFLTHNYPHTHSTRLILSPRDCLSRCLGSLLKPDLAADYRVRLTQPSVRNCFKSRPQVGAERFPLKDRVWIQATQSSAVGWITMGTLWLNFKLLLISSFISMTSFSCFKSFP